MADTDLVDALEDTWAATIAVCGDLADEEWLLETGCPGWTVKDNVAHLAGLEAGLLGRPAPDHTVPDYPHLRNDFGRMMEVAVDVRRPLPAAEVLAEFAEVTAERLRILRALSAEAFESEGPGPLGSTMKVRDLLGIRVFDSWAHEQDIRRAVGRPGGLDGRPAVLARDRIALGVARAAAKVAEVPAGASIAFDVEGPFGPGFTVRVDEGGRGVAIDGVDPGATATISTQSDNFLALVFGRADVAGDDIRATGDQAVADRMLAHMGLTP